jgi:type IV secretory pathway VirB2 component (pilin)
MSIAAGSASGSLLAAAQWMEALIHGPITTALAVLAVAGTGLMMLSGRFHVRRALGVTLGCFILFGAPVFARGLMTSAVAARGPVLEPPSPLAAVYDQPMAPPSTSPATDPYAGASIAQ